MNRSAIERGTRMSGVEAGLVKLGQAVATQAVRAWLADRQRHDERVLPLSELVNRRVTDGFAGRRFLRETESMADAVAERLVPLAKSDRAGLPENERLAALDAVVDTFAAVAGSDEVLFAADADVAKLTALMRTRARNVPVRAGLSERAHRFYDAVLAECCQSYVQAVITLGPFTPRATAELLGRITGQGELLARILSRLPLRSLDAPAGTEEDAEFRRRYLRLVSTGLDEVVLFGIDTRRYRPRATLSLAYVSLTVQVKGHDDAGSTDVWRATDPRDPAPDVSMRVERALGQSPRTLIRGEAGSGKTTILHWLAVTAARARFTGELADWNGCVPFLVRLRTFVEGPLPRPEQLTDGIGDPIAGLMPPGWAHRVLATGRAVVLVDGVDELPAPRRAEVRDWLRGLLTEFPAVRVVVTARPAAAAANWLQDNGFAPAALAPMRDEDVRGLVGHWHRAVREAPDLPCQPEDLPRYEAALLGRLSADPHLQALATTPLLCAMLCALSLDRRTYLPRNRMALYAAAVDMLLERRDLERRVPTGEDTLPGEDRLRILQHLAWRLSVNGVAETARATAVAWIADKIRGMPQVAGRAEDVYAQLLHRSGMVREPVEGRVDFVHRTFQEYLTAREAAEQGDVGLLVERAHLDTWRQVVVMAAGHANTPVRTELLTGILDRADTERRYRRALTLVAAAAIETMPSLEPATLFDRLHTAVDGLIPPRGRAEARSLAAVGEPILRRLPTDLTGLSEAAAAATVRTAALVNGKEALGLLAGYANDPRGAVQSELINQWQRFDPHEYAAQVLAHAPLLDGYVRVHSIQTALAAKRLTNLRQLAVYLGHPVDVSDLDDVHMLWGLYLNGGLTGGLATLPRHEHLSMLRIVNEHTIMDPNDIPELPNLGWLFIREHPSITNLDFLSRTPNVDLVALGSVAEIEDFSTLADLPNLYQLSLVHVSQSDLSRIPLQTMRHVALHRIVAPKGGLESLVRRAPNVYALELAYTDWVQDLSPLAELRDLTNLCLRETPVEDLEPLSRLTNLERLDLIDCPVRDLSPLAALPNLRRVWLRGLDNVDPGSFEARSTIVDQELADSAMLGRSFAQHVLAAQRPIVELRPRRRSGR
jgi:NACHT domain